MCIEIMNEYKQIVGTSEGEEGVIKKELSSCKLHNRDRESVAFSCVGHYKTTMKVAVFD